MTVLEAISLFKNEMVNELSHRITDDYALNESFEALDIVGALVIETYEAEKKHKRS